MALSSPFADEAVVPRDEVLWRLGTGAAIDAPTVVVVAHPDDETVGLGGRLASVGRLTLVHVTDGAPTDPTDARRAGFAGRAAYRAVRAVELRRALAALEVAPSRLSLGVRDQGAAAHLTELSHRLADLLVEAELVISHAYEGGHPDHDACAFAVQAACDLVARRGWAPPQRLEFAGYHKREGLRACGVFWPDPAHPAVRAALSPQQLARKQRALAEFASQAEVIAWFDPAVEAYRAAPRYDFTRPPPPGAALYDDWGWALTSTVWRDKAEAALGELGLLEARR